MPSVYLNDGCNFDCTIETPNPQWFPTVKARYRLADNPTRYRWANAGPDERPLLGAEIIAKHLLHLGAVGDDGSLVAIDLAPGMASGLHGPIFDGLVLRMVQVIPPVGSPVPKSAAGFGSPCSTPNSPSVPIASDGSTTSTGV